MFYNRDVAAVVAGFSGCRSIAVARGVSLPVCRFVYYESASACRCDDPNLFGAIYKLSGATAEFGRCGTMHFPSADALAIARAMTNDFFSFGRVSHYCCGGTGVVLHRGSAGSYRGRDIIRLLERDYEGYDSDA